MNECSATGHGLAVSIRGCLAVRPRRHGTCRNPQRRCLREGAFPNVIFDMNETKRRGRARVVVASSLALFVALNAAIGAPSSEFAPRDSVWWKLDPPMWPALSGGVVLGLIALAASAVSARGGAVVCVLASLLTATGTVVAAGTSDHQALGFYAVFVAVALIPATIAVTVFVRR